MKSCLARPSLWRSASPAAIDTYEQTVFRRRTGFWLWTAISAIVLLEVWRMLPDES